jgi:hypothetical protein
MLITSFQSKQNKDATFRFIASGDAMELFRGSFLVPSIKKATPLNKEEILVEDQIGLQHKERIVQGRLGEILVFHIDPNRLLRLFIRGISEEWLFEENARGTKVTRIFSLIPRWWSAPFLPLFYYILAKAIKQNNATLCFHLMLENKTLKKPLLFYDA